MSRVRVKKLIKKENIPLTLEKRFLLPFDWIDIIEGFQRVKGLKAEITGNVIKINGEVKILLIYKIKGIEQGINSFSMPLEFNHEVTLNEIKGKIYPNIKGEINRIELKVKQGTIVVKLEVSLIINIFEIEEVFLLTESDYPENYIGKTLMDLNEIIDLIESEIISEENISIPEDKPPLNELIDINTHILISDKYIHGNKVIIKGLVKYEIIYKTNDFNRPIDKLYFSNRFNSTVDLKHLSQSITLIPNVEVIGIDQVIKDCTEKDLKIYNRVSFSVLLSRQRILSVVTKLPDLIDGVKESSIMMEKPLIKKVERIKINDIIDLSELSPLPMRILGGGVNDYYIYSLDVTDGFINLNGRLNLHIEYQIKDNKKIDHQIQDILHHKDVLEFNKEITLDGLKKGMNVEVDLRITDQKFEVIRENRINVIIDLIILNRVSSLEARTIYYREAYSTI